MSGRARDTGNDLPSSQGQSDLSDLRASRECHTTKVTPPANDADLSSASISATNILRASAQREGPRHSLSNIRSAALNNRPDKRSSSPSAQPTSPNGILKNPTYKYEGGFISKVITFVANILKFLERLFLRLLGARDLVAPKQTPLSRPSTQEHSTPGTKKKSKKDDERAVNLITRS